MLQNEVRPNLARGVAGDLARATHSYYLPDGAIAGDGNVCAGCFVKIKNGDRSKVFGASGVAFTPASEQIVGVCIRDHLFISQNPTLIYPQGSQVQYLEKGVIWIETETSAKVGQFVFIKNADGSLVFGDTDTLEDHTFTGFRVTIGGTTSNNNPIIIEITR